MDVSSISQSLGSDYINKITKALSTSTNGTSATTDTSGAFDSVYNSALGLISDTNNYINQAQQAEVDFSLGKLTSTHELSVAQQKANLSLQYTVAIRDKVLDAYKEIMNMTI